MHFTVQHNTYPNIMVNRYGKPGYIITDYLYLPAPGRTGMHAITQGVRLSILSSESLVGFFPTLFTIFMMFLHIQLVSLFNRDSS